MVENLKIALSEGVAVTASYNNGTTFSFTPNSGASNSYNTVFNGNTVTPYTNGVYYYTHYAATAGKGTNTFTGDVNGSICPKGWKLPYDSTINSSVSWKALVDAYSITKSTTFLNYPLDFSEYTGRFVTGNLVGSGTAANFWSSSKGTVNHGYSLYFTSANDIRPGISWPAYQGYPIRCVAVR